MNEVLDMCDVSALRCTRCRGALDAAGQCPTCDAHDILEARRAMAEVDAISDNPAALRRYLRRQRR